MLPIVRGEPETARQILLVLAAARRRLGRPLLLPAVGPFYLGAALVLGGLFVYYAQRLWREATRAAALRLYKYSLLYLALIFVAVVVDHQVFR